MCSHRSKKLLVDMTRGNELRYQIMCACCMVCTEPQHTGMAAWLHWLRDRRLELV